MPPVWNAGRTYNLRSHQTIQVVERLVRAVCPGPPNGARRTEGRCRVRCFRSAWAFVTGASLLAGARNYCLRRQWPDVGKNCKCLALGDLESGWIWRLECQCLKGFTVGHAMSQ